MKKSTEKQPVDNLFAQKLKNMSLPPDPDGFARLQVKMRRSDPEMRVLFGQNPVLQWYAAVASLLLVCFSAGLYVLFRTSVLDKATSSINKPATSTEKKRSDEPLDPDPAVRVATTGSTLQRKLPGLINIKLPDSTLAKRDELAISKQARKYRQLVRGDKMSPRPGSTVVLTKEAERIDEMEVNGPTSEPMDQKQATTTPNKPTSVAERVLIVTIAEPEVQLADRQLVRVLAGDESPAISTDKPGKESKAANLWQQMKRIKQGEIVARKDVDEDERSLLGRAYNGLRQTLDRDKSIKQ